LGDGLLPQGVISVTPEEALFVLKNFFTRIWFDI
jgi:hypothetical protein